MPTSRGFVTLLISLSCVSLLVSCDSSPDIDSVTEVPDHEVRGDSVEHFYFHTSERGHPADWSYSGATGPEHWGSLSPDYRAADVGLRQSPIDLSTGSPKAGHPLEFHYRPAQIDLMYDGHTIKETEEPGSCLVVDTHRYELKQFHFHSPSEHTIDGRHFEMEMHLVHRDRRRRIAVVAVLIREGVENEAVAPVWDYLPSTENKHLRYEDVIDAADFLPTERGYWHYDGSFTTPPCTESVAWYVLTSPIELSPSQIARFRKIIDGNSRPIQPLNGRKVMQSR